VWSQPLLDSSHSTLYYLDVLRLDAFHFTSMPELEAKAHRANGLHGCRSSLVR
jgi:hypothetical protein